MFVNAVEIKQGSAFIHKYAKQHSYDVLRAINEGYFTKQQAVDYLDMENWVWLELYQLIINIGQNKQ